MKRRDNASVNLWINIKRFLHGGSLYPDRLVRSFHDKKKALVLYFDWKNSAMAIPISTMANCLTSTKSITSKDCSIVYIKTLGTSRAFKGVARDKKPPPLPSPATIHPPPIPPTTPPPPPPTHTHTNPPPNPHQPPRTLPPPHTHTNPSHVEYVHIVRTVHTVPHVVMQQPCVVYHLFSYIITM